MDRNFLYLEADFFLKKSLPEEIGPGRKRKLGLICRIDMLGNSNGHHFFINGHFAVTEISLNFGNYLLKGCLV